METQLNQISIVIHNVMTKIHYYNMSRTKKSFSWTFNTYAVYKILFIHPSVNEIPFSCNHLRNSTQSFIWCHACLQNLQAIRGTRFLGALSLNSEEEP
jgi:hypothetical protein